MKYVFVENPIAGNKKKRLLFKRVQSAFRLSDDEMIIEETLFPHHAQQIAHAYAENYGDDAVIVSCGGDGTIHEIANGLAGTDTPLMVIPLGTGNDFAKKIYGTRKINLENVVKSFGLHNGDIRYDVKPIDLIDYNGEKCINIMSYGLDTLVETIGRKIAAKVPFLGKNAYTMAVLPVFMKPLKYSLNIDFKCIDKDGNKFDFTATPHEYALMAICNASYYGGGFCPAPDSVLDDGLLDLVYVDSMSLPKAVPLVPKYSSGQLAHEENSAVHMAYVTSGRIWTDDGSALLGNCDGENFDYTDVHFHVDKHALKLCVLKE